MKSMTGYGNDVFHLKGTVITVEIKSVNSRYLDIISKIPRSLQQKEQTLKQILQGYFNRGRVELYITIAGEPLKNKKVFVDWQLLDEYMLKLDEVRRKYDIGEGLSLSAIVNQEELFVIQEENTTNESFHELLMKSVEATCEQVVATRSREGAFLKKDVSGRIENLHSSLQYIDANSEEIHRQYQKRMESRILKYLDQSVEVDQNLLIQEIATLAEKGDIQEEITRLYSHLDHFKVIVEQDKEIGRKLDFIVQEMHRETNTIGAKSIDARISEETVKIKSEIEKIKEQIQNIE